MSDTKPAEAPPAPSGFAPSWDAVSAALGTTARQWVTYSKRPGFPSKTPQGYDLAALAAWKAANVGKSDADGTLKAAKLEKIAEETALLRIRRAKEERKSVNIEEVNDLHRRMALKLRAYLYTKLENEMPPKLAGCDALTIRKHGRALADEIVRTLAGDIETWTDA